MLSKKTIIISLLLTLTTISNSSYYSFVKDNNYKLKETFIKEYSEWINIDSEYCESDVAKEDLYYGSGLENISTIEKCYQKKERLVSLYEMNENNEKTLYSSNVELINEKISEKDLFSNHIEASCNDIIINGYGSTDGVYKVGSIDDNFDVYCDMRENEGWTLFGKVNTSNRDSVDEPNNWFVAGKNIVDILDPNDNLNVGMSALGIFKINKLNIGNVTEFKLLSQNLGQEASFYKESNKANMATWFNVSETTATKVCVDSNLSQNCRGSQFISRDVYDLTGMNLVDFGYETGGFLHLRMNNSDNSFNSGICSYTFIANNNHWNDTYNTHWGNGMLIYAK